MAARPGEDRTAAPLETEDSTGDAANEERTSGKAESGLFVGSVEKAFEVLRILGTSPIPMGLSEVVKVTAMGKSSAQRFLHTLTALGYVNQDKETKAYSISAQILDLAQSYLGAEGLREKASHFLRAANLQTEETINLTLLDRLSVVYLMRYPGFHQISVDLSIGSKLPAFCTAPGRTILAYMEEVESNWILEKSDIKAYTPYTITDKQKIVGTFKQIRRNGYFISNQEAFVGDISVAAPVFNWAGRILAAVNIAVPTSRWSVKEVAAKLMPIAVRTASEISAALGHPSSKALSKG
ncbi:IclR family transcriptional regulator [Variovorax sp. PBL-E5]|uniref:IclR family transcriptional regulator n=1 Tax=Variovorax sp. PBL-E5 TaxID=434014 RepID=UPI001317D33A|nr:IclR family transcriptional regulator [Variovorax sp. PBL-E5]VTU45377.1 Pca regulon regulatory protein [Variovorax sp. PBL-E5]